jgi:hypothetical protein
MKTPQLIALFIGALILTSCNPVKSTAEADKAAAEFHALFDAEDYEKIFDAAHADFKASQPKVDTIDFLRSVREKLGTTKSTNRTRWQANSFNMKTNVVLTFETEFENGKGVETFTYRIADGSAVLLGWHVSSNALVVTKSKGEPGGAGQPAAAPESKSVEKDKPQPKS